MKKIIALLLIVSICICAFACGKEIVPDVTSETSSTYDTASSKSTEKMPGNGEHPTEEHSVIVKIDGNPVGYYGTLQSSHIAGVWADGYGILMSSVEYAVDKVSVYQTSRIGTLEIEVDGKKVETVKVYNAVGKPLMSDEGTNKYSVDGLFSTLPMGDYIVKFEATSSGTGDFAEEYATMEYLFGFTTCEPE